ncbi:MAG: formylglycine-generating enzyme family protein [Gemmatimonadota bacterium]|jgi:formylglycine-generating enzyme required for sulfatase activity|nr:formylglycine-generating enzyme family protein [Gemmatimonadota bacterium]
MHTARNIGLLFLILGVIPGCGPDSVIENSIGMKFAYIPAGEFQMGSDRGEEDEQPRHGVRITQSFYLGIYEVTQAQWERVMGTTLSEHHKTQDQNLPLNEIGPDHPMYFVSWDDTQAFIERLNALEGKAVYRLPTEAEWEYACRARTQEAYAGNIDQMAWYAGTSENKIHPVGRLQPNEWGLYDMHGNVWEWCHDWLDRNYYKKGQNTDPQGGPPGERRIIRGGGWYNDADACRSAYRSYTSPGRGGPHLGFRVVRTVN